MTILKTPAARSFGFVLLITVLTNCGQVRNTIGSSGNDPYSAGTSRTNIAAQPFPYAWRTDATAPNPDTTKSWMSSQATNDDLLYISNTDSQTVSVYSYTKRKLLGTLTGFEQPYSLCVDAEQNVYVTNDYRLEMIEYAHGGTKPIKYLGDPDGYPIGCAVDPTTGDLAVTNLTGFAIRHNIHVAGEVLIYKHAKGVPVRYVDPTIPYYYFAAYDDHGNLFIDGDTCCGVGVAELVEGARKFTDITLDQSIEFPGAVQWDGKRLAVGDQDASVIYRFAISGSTGHLESTVPLGGAIDVFQFWLPRLSGGARDDRVVGADHGDKYYIGDIGFWKYPQGGSPVEIIGNIQGASGAVVSKGQSSNRTQSSRR
jgi:DNA-binding beta-propeller fold protein YncE